jgi:hypothetical protein
MKDVPTISEAMGVTACATVPDAVRGAQRIHLSLADELLGTPSVSVAFRSYARQSFSDDMPARDERRRLTLPPSLRNEVAPALVVSQQRLSRFLKQLH